MSDRDFRRNLWISVLSAIIVTALVGIATNVLTAQKTTGRSLRNEVDIHNIQNELKTTAKKGEYNGMHQTLFIGQKNNEDRIIKQNEKHDDQYQFLIERLQEVNQNILNLHLNESD